MARDEFCQPLQACYLQSDRVQNDRVQPKKVIAMLPWLYAGFVPADLQNKSSPVHSMTMFTMDC